MKWGLIALAIYFAAYLAIFAFVVWTGAMAFGEGTMTQIEKTVNPEYVYDEHGRRHYVG